MDSIINPTSRNPTIRSIVLAEDDDDDQVIFQTALKEVDNQINLNMVSDGRQLLAFLQNYYPDILFLDLEMPYKNGLECLVQIRANDLLEKLPVVMFSSTTRASNIQTAYEMGAHLFFIKPVVYQECVSSIRSILHLDWKTPERVREQYCINGRYTAFS